MRSRGLRLWIPVIAGMTLVSAYAEPIQSSDVRFKELYSKAQSSLSPNDKKKFDFYIARYLGLASLENPPVHRTKDLETLIQKRKLAPKAFVPSTWDPAFIEWFVKGLYARWAVPDERVREKARSFEIANAAYQDQYFVTVVAYPELELWHVVENGLVTRPLWMLMGSASDKPVLFFGKIFKGFSSFQFHPLYLDTRKRQLLYVWKPEFYDLDQDGVPEVWIRYDLSRGNGFSGVLEIYRIKNESELVLMKRFQGGDESVARRLPDGTVELASGAGSHEGFSRLNYDVHRFERWEYHDGEFHQISKEDKPFLLSSPAWKEYFLETSAK